MSEHTDTLIGHLLEVRNGQFVAKLLSEEEGFCPTVSVDGELSKWSDNRDLTYRSVSTVFDPWR